MADCKTLSDSDLWDQTKQKAKEERKLTLEVITLLREVESRRLFAKRGFSSLFEYCTQELGYAESEAYRRISAMRLTREMPEIESKIDQGSLTLTNLVQASAFFKAEEKMVSRIVDVEEKRQVLKTLENKSTREAEKELRSRNPAGISAVERVRQVTGEKTEIKIVINEELKSKLEELKHLMSHKNPNMNYTELFAELADMALKKLKPKRTVGEVASRRSDSSAQKVTSRNPRYVPQWLRQIVRAKAGDACSYVDPVSKRKCDSKHLLEIDHIQPVALGGKTEIGNLRLLCRMHNQMAASEILGDKAMRKFMPL